MGNNLIEIKSDLLMERCHYISKVFASFILMVGVLVILGWSFGIEPLKNILTSWASMKANTAICFIFLGISIWALPKAGISPKLTILATCFSTIVIVIAGLTLYEYIFKQDVGIDQFLFKDHETDYSSFPGRMYYLTVLNFILCGFSVLGFTLFKQKLAPLAQILILIVFLIALGSLLGRSYGTHYSYNLYDYRHIALHTSIGFLAASIGIFSSKPDHGFTKIFLVDSVSGSLAWKILPSVVFIPPILGFIAVGGEKIGLYNAEFKVFILVTSFILIFTSLIFSILYSLHNSENKISCMSEKLGTAEQKNEELLYTTKQLEIISNHDPLTGLANRLFFHSLLEHAINKAVRYKSMVVVFFMDLDKFKEANDTFGHATGDQILIEVAKRVKLAIRTSDTLARISGDEFTAILEENITKKNVTNIALRIINSLNKPFNINNQNILLTASIGISCYPKDATELASLIKTSDIAMYQAKKLGGNTYCFYQPIEDIN